MRPSSDPKPSQVVSLRPPPPLPAEAPMAFSKMYSEPFTVRLADMWQSASRVTWFGVVRWVICSPENAHWGTADVGRAAAARAQATMRGNRGGNIERHWGFTDHTKKVKALRDTRHSFPSLYIPRRTHGLLSEQIRNHRSKCYRKCFRRWR